MKYKGTHGPLVLFVSVVLVKGRASQQRTPVRNTDCLAVVEGTPKR